MRKRLRKKRHLSEFQELGFEVAFQILGFEDSEQETDRLFEFLDEAIEANGMYFGGSGKEGKWSGVIYSLNRHGSPMTEIRRDLVISWLRANEDFEFLEASELFDVWYGDLPSESKQPAPNLAIPADRDPPEGGSRPLNSHR